MGYRRLPFVLFAGAICCSGCGDDDGGAGGAGGDGAGGDNATGGSLSGPLVSCGHAHNDYEHDRPVHDAVERGFCSLEADVFLVGASDLLVAHEAAETDPARTLQSLYLDPLRQLAEEGVLAGPGGGPLILLIDVKSSAAETYAVLDPILATYADLLTVFEGDTVTPGAVTAVISGGRDYSTMAAQSIRYAALDGRVGDETDFTKPDTPASLVPLVSQRWGQLFSFPIDGQIPEEEQQLLRGYVDQSHAEGRLVRFWATPNDPGTWSMLATAEVDLINVDDLEAFEVFVSQFE